MKKLEERILKVTGAVEALESLLEHCRSHTIPIEECAVSDYLDTTRDALQELKRKRKAKR
jgi:hypothetical protein